MFGSDISLASDKAKEVVKTATDNLSPLLRDVEIRLGGLIHSLLDRINIKVDIHFSIDPAKAKYANPPPENDKVY